MRDANGDFQAFAWRWAMALTSQPSVTGSTDEAGFGSWLADALRKDPAFAGASVWSQFAGVNIHARSWIPLGHQVCHTIRVRWRFAVITRAGEA
jgi:hypothetical protein